MKLKYHLISLSVLTLAACGGDDDPSPGGGGSDAGGTAATGGTGGSDTGGSGGTTTGGSGGGGNAGAGAVGGGGVGGGGVGGGGAGGAGGSMDGGPDSTADGGSPCPSPIAFTDVTSQAGVVMAGELNESLAWGDIDGDGDEDLYVTTQGANHMFRNNGDGTFTDVTAQTGTTAPGFGVGAAFGDLDNDGDLDLYVVNFNPETDLDRFLRNDGVPEGGTDPVFTEIATLAGTTNGTSSRGLAFVDYDRDGLLDIYVNAIGPDILYHNDGGLQFTNVAATELGAQQPTQGVGVVATDVNTDGWPDLFVANRSNHPTNLFLGGPAVASDGGDAGSAPRFTDIAQSAGITASGLGMGIIAFDYDNDLKVDLYWTAWPGETAPLVTNKLYRNENGTMFSDMTAASGTEDTAGWGISANAGDIDNDGYLDFFVTNGFDDVVSGPNTFFYNNGDGTFTDIASCIGFGPSDGRGVAFADYDDDGDLDLMVTGDVEADSQLFRNDTVNTNAWLELVLEDAGANISGIGARVEVTAGGVTRMREASSGAGRGSGNSQVIHFGLGAATAVSEVRIVWADGTEQLVGSTAINQKLVVQKAGADGG